MSAASHLGQSESGEFVAGDAGYGPLAAADGEYAPYFSEPPKRSSLWCRIGFHDWRVTDHDGVNEDRLNVLACRRCGRER